MINEDDLVIGNYDEDLKPINQMNDDRDYSFALLIGDIEKIRKTNGAYIWGFPIKWYEQDKLTKTMYGWEIEFNNGFCITVGYQRKCFNTYMEALQDAINYFKTNTEGDRSILPKQD